MARCEPHGPRLRAGELETNFDLQAEFDIHERTAFRCKAAF